jgi:hypothetical protein
MKRIVTCAALIAFATLDTSPLHAQSPTVPSDADIRQIFPEGPKEYFLKVTGQRIN